MINNENEYVSAFAHRLVAEVFIDNPENKLFVDHIDRDSTNNKLSNLRWATGKENANNKNKKNNNYRKPVIQFKDNIFIKRWDSIKEVAEYFNVSTGIIINRCTKNTLLNDFTLKFEDNNIKDIDGEIWKIIPINSKKFYYASNMGRIKNQENVY